jgi:rubrerythrin
MASRCPECGRPLDEDAICCAGVRHTWKCTGCGKRSQGFVVPYGRCFLCGEPIELVDTALPIGDPRTVQPILEAVQMEANAIAFYRLAAERAGDGRARAVLEDMRDREREHLDELVRKYHLRLDDALVTGTPQLDRELDRSMFGDLADAGDDIPAIYERALQMERRALAFFRARAAECPPGRERELYRELAAEEDEHIALLESELGPAD